MWLFDNIFLDKDTPTALLDNPEIKSPDSPKKVEKAYDPKNDPIAPAVTGKETDTANNTGSDVSFDIGWDIDFSDIGKAEEVPKDEIKTDVPPAETPSTAGAEEIHLIDSGVSEDPSSSIAMVQGWTATAIDSIDIGGIPAIDFHIHDIEDHHEETQTEEAKVEEKVQSEEENKPVGDWIFSLMWTPDVPVEIVATTEIQNEIPKIEEPLETLVFSDAIPHSSIEIWAPLWTSWVGGNGRIQELIAKLIEEMKKLDEEEKWAIKERQNKLASITSRKEALEHEYQTRKEALTYEEQSIVVWIDKSVEKARINALIDGFKEDLASE